MKISSLSEFVSAYLSDDGSPKRGHVDMSVFRDAVEDCIDYEPETCKKAPKPKSSNERNVEKFSGLRIR